MKIGSSILVTIVRLTPVFLLLAGAGLASYGLFDPWERGILGRQAIGVGIVCVILALILGGASIRLTMNHPDPKGKDIIEAFVVVTTGAAVVFTFVAIGRGPWWFAWICWCWAFCTWRIRKILFPNFEELQKYLPKPERVRLEATPKIQEPLPMWQHHTVKIDKIEK